MALLYPSTWLHFTAKGIMVNVVSFPELDLQTRLGFHLAFISHPPPHNVILCLLAHLGAAPQARATPYLLYFISISREGEHKSFCFTPFSGRLDTSQVRECATHAHSRLAFGSRLRKSLNGQGSWLAVASLALRVLAYCFYLCSPFSLDQERVIRSRPFLLSHSCG